MAYSSIAFIALAAAQAAAPQSEIQQPAHAFQTEPVAQVASPVPAPAAAAQTLVQSAPTRTILWRNVESGMSVSQLRSLYPAGAAVSYKDDRTILTDVQIIEGCQAKVNIMHEAGAVKEIVMRGEGAIAGRCSLKIIAALSGKYGEPLEKDKVKGSLFAREGKNYVWTRDGITLQFKRYTSGALGGGGLFAASWELRYAANATNIDL